MIKDNNKDSKNEENKNVEFSNKHEEITKNTQSLHNYDQIDIEKEIKELKEKGVKGYLKEGLSGKNKIGSDKNIKNENNHKKLKANNNQFKNEDKSNYDDNDNNVNNHNSNNDIQENISKENIRQNLQEKINIVDHNNDKTKKIYAN